MNKIRDAFEGIHADTQMKETTKQFLAEKYEEGCDYFGITCSGDWQRG